MHLTLSLLRCSPLLFPPLCPLLFPLPPYIHTYPIHSMGMLFGADRETFAGLAGVGDTFGTCLGPLSRNRQVGKHA
jgi:hypothetical protein